MSGTSLDGLDIAYCEFQKTGTDWKFKLIAGDTIPYSKKWISQLIRAPHLTGEELLQLNEAYGDFLGKACNDFIRQNKIKDVDFIASHGHTVFHQPKKKFTFQLGDGVALHESTRIAVINDFRSLDVRKGGQGAPLVPVGDHYLFSRFDVCLNLGGIGNLSATKNGQRIAFDICFANMGLNYLAGKVNKKFDRGGKLSSKGKVNSSMLRQLNSRYKLWRREKPSLGREGFEKFIKPILDNESIALTDRLRTFSESICVQVKENILYSSGKIKLLVTGGGALNDFLIQLLKARLGGGVEVIVPDASIVNYKEAIVFAFLGVLRIGHQTNVLKSVTGASSDSCAGTMIGF